MHKLILTLLIFAFSNFLISQSAFITSWDINASFSNQPTLTIKTSGENYNYTVDWGDGNITTEHAADAEHTYASFGIYQVSITGEFPHLFIDDTSPQKEQLMSVDQWGDQEWLSMESAFSGCKNLIILATDTPNLSKVQSTSHMFFRCESFNQDIGDWDVSNITDMSFMFGFANRFNQDIGNWNVSNVKNMDHIFGAARNFNQDIGDWDVSSVTNMDGMFSSAIDFNQDLNDWDVSHVTRMSYMFYNTLDFNQNIGDWDMGSVKTTERMFYLNKIFNQDISKWDVSSVDTMSHMFSATVFNSDIGNWDVSNVTHMDGMFSSNKVFNQDIGDWDVSNVVNMESMFTWALAFDQNISRWDISKVTTMRIMFWQAGMSTQNYDALLRSWVLSNPQSDVSFHAGENTKYCLGETARKFLTDAYNWDIIDGGSINNCSFPKIVCKSQYDSDNCDDESTLVNKIKYVVRQEDADLEYIIHNGGCLELPNFGPGYTIKAEVENSDQFTISPDSIVISTNTNSQDLDVRFCIRPNFDLVDVEITVIPLEIARPGFDITYKIVISNHGSIPVSDTIEFIYPSEYMRFLQSDPEISGEETDKLLWNYVNLQPFQTQIIYTDFNLNSPMDHPPLNSGDLLNIKGIVYPLGIDIKRANNYSCVDQEVVNSFDPNDKTCLQGSFIQEELIGEYLHYLIRFENTGTANAENVVITDVLDRSRFDVSSLRLLDSSHPVELEINKNKLHFNFIDINLPFEDDLNDGFVAFKIKTRSDLQLGDEITNTASIFFDFNFPIVTNTTSTTIGEITHIKEVKEFLPMELFPNPSRDFIQVNTLENFERMELYNANGNLVRIIENLGTKKIYINHLDSGVYILKGITQSGTFGIQKFIKL